MLKNSIIIINFCFFLMVYSCKPLIPIVGRYYYFEKIYEGNFNYVKKSLNKVEIMYTLDSINYGKKTLFINDLKINGDTIQGITLDIIFDSKKECNVFLKSVDTYDRVKSDYKRNKKKYKKSVKRKLLGIFEH